ncbi:MAG: FAD-binding oxidoreductase, partial [Phycisphaerae bacterium]|nr:FAD-binding oxidoreductase [Phycisphaerae bacterium]
MLDPELPVSRRTTLKGIAIGGLGLLSDGTLQAEANGDGTAPMEVVMESNDAWFAQRAWSVSANKLLTPQSGPGGAVTCLAKSIHRPKSAADIAAIIRSVPASTPIACVCGGHESSNAALVANGQAIVLDLIALKSIEFHSEGDERFVTVGSGVVFRELVEAVRARGGALPVGTGPGVGVAGYVTNGGLSSYFSRRLGLLGQRVVKMTVVTAAGEVRVITPADDLFNAMLGAGSALAVVVDITLRLADASVIKGAEQRVFGFENREQAVRFARESMRFMRERIIPNESVSLEVVVTGTKAIVATTVFYDSFTGDPVEFVKPLEELAASMKLPELARAHWSSWYEAAAALWPVIAGQKGNPLATLYHCAGTTGAPGDVVIDFVSDTVVGQAPLDEAP